MADTQTPKRILIVDDEDIMRQLLATVLAEQGEITEAASGAEALQLAGSVSPDVILLDVQMPGMDGYEVCKRLKENEKTAQIPVVFLTASSSNEDEERGLDIGATDFIRKPLSAKIIQARISNILNLRAAHKELQRLASTDPLTGAFNRRYFLETGNAELHRSRRYEQPFTVLMLDIDHFKAVNDTYGHGIGDDALKETVRVIQSLLRGEDTLGRLGGEEFAVIFPQTIDAGASFVAERIRKSISEIVIETSQGPLTFTMSIGVTASDAEDDSIEDILNRADGALYQAKEQGRDRVISV